MGDSFDTLADGPGLADFLPDVSQGFTAHAGAPLEQNASQSDELAVIDALQCTIKVYVVHSWESWAVFVALTSGHSAYCKVSNILDCTSALDIYCKSLE